MRRRRVTTFVGSVVAVIILGCVPPQPTAEPVVRAAHYTYTPTPPCAQTGSAKLTLALVSPRWQDPMEASGMSPQARAAYGYSSATPKFYVDLTSAMRADFLQLVTCRGYLAKGPFDSFESMVYPDRTASQLLLEPELLISVDITNIAQETPGFLSSLNSGLNHTAATAKLKGTATVGGRVNLNLKEPVTNTRMWTRTIELPAETFAFETTSEYPQNITTQQAKAIMLNDAGLLSVLIPKMETMYGRVFTAAEGYMNKDEIASVAVQAADVRSKAGIKIPPQ